MGPQRDLDETFSGEFWRRMEPERTAFVIKEATGADSQIGSAEQNKRDSKVSLSIKLNRIAQNRE